MHGTVVRAGDATVSGKFMVTPAPGGLYSFSFAMTFVFVASADPGFEPSSTCLCLRESNVSAIRILEQFPGEEIND